MVAPGPPEALYWLARHADPVQQGVEWLLVGGPGGIPAVDQPRSSLTPGVALHVGTAAICRPGYASSVRNVPSSESDAVYGRYGVTHVPYAHEVDHLISLEIGGSNAIRNL